LPEGRQGTKGDGEFVGCCRLAILSEEITPNQPPASYNELAPTNPCIQELSIRGGAAFRLRGAPPFPLPPLRYDATAPKPEAKAEQRRFGATAVRPLQRE